MPLEAIAKAGAMKQDEFDKSNEELRSSTDLLGKFNTRASLKIYGQQGIQDSELGFENKKNQLLSSLNSKRDKLADDLMSGKIDPRDPSLFNLKREAKLAANELQAYQDVAKQVNETNDVISKSSEYATDPHYATELLKYNTDWKKDADNGKIRNYAPPGIGTLFNIQKAALDFKFNDNGREIVNIGDYIRTSSDIGVAQEKVKQAADAVFNDPNSEVRQNIELSLKHDIRMNPGQYQSNDDVVKELETRKKNWEDMVMQHAGMIHKEDVKADPYSLQGEKSKLDDAVIPITSLAIRSGEGSQFKRSDDFDSKYKELKQSNSDIINNASVYKDRSGRNALMPSQINLLKLAAEGNSNVNLSSFAANPEQMDLIKNYLSDINQNNVIENNAKKQEKRSKIASGLGENWVPSKEAENAGDYYKLDISHTEKTINDLKRFISEGIMVDVNKGQLSEYETILNDLKDKKSDAMKSADPKYKKYEEYLNKNSELSSETMALTSISSKSLQETLGSILERDLTKQGGLGAKDFKTGEMLSDDKYETIGKVDPKSISYYFEKGEPRLVVRPDVARDKSGAKMDYIDMKAPLGVKEHILHNGTITERQLASSSIVDEVSVDSPIVLNNGVSVRKLSNTDIVVAPNSRNYEVEYKGEVKNYSKQELIALLAQ